MKGKVVFTPADLQAGIPARSNSTGSICRRREWLYAEDSKATVCKSFIFWDIGIEQIDVRPFFQ